MKPTRIWGTVEGLQDVTCNVHTCTQLRPGTRRHRIPLGGRDKHLKAWDEYRVPDRLVRYLLTGSQEGTVLRVLPRAPVSQLVTVNDVVIAATPETILVNYQCMMRIGLRFGAQQGTVLNVLIDTGAQSNLIRTGLVPDRLWKEARTPLEFRTVSHEMLPGGTREIEAQLWFYGILGTGVHVPNHQEDAVFYDAQIHVDAILGYPWLLSRGLGVVPSRTGTYLWIKQSMGQVLT